MLTYPEIDPVAIHVAGWPVHWYGVMYLIGFIAAWNLGTWRARHTINWTRDQVGDVIFYGALGVILGGRLGYVVFYEPRFFWHHPLAILQMWDGGMAFHGALIGVMVAFLLARHTLKKEFFEITDFVAPLVPIGLACGRIGNFINGELWGRVTDLPWAMVFPNAGPYPRHPSQLYECLTEGLFLFILLWWYSSKPRPRMAVSGLFLVGYGLIRFLIEFVREPDPQWGFIAFNWLTMGQLLSLPMVIAGVAMMVVAYRRAGV